MLNSNIQVLIRHLGFCDVTRILWSKQRVRAKGASLEEGSCQISSKSYVPFLNNRKMKKVIDVSTNYFLSLCVLCQRQKDWRYFHGNFQFVGGSRFALAPDLGKLKIFHKISQLVAPPYRQAHLPSHLYSMDCNLYLFTFQFFVFFSFFFLS